MSTGTEHAGQQQYPVAPRYGVAPTGDPAPPYVRTGSHTHARDAFGNAVLPPPQQAGHPGTGTGNMATPGGHHPDSGSDVSSMHGTPAAKRPEAFETYTGGKDDDGDQQRDVSTDQVQKQQHGLDTAFMMTSIQTLTEALDKLKEENKSLTDLIRDLTDDDIIRNLMDKAKGEAKNDDAKEPNKNDPQRAQLDRRQAPDKDDGDKASNDVDLRDIDRKDVDKPNK